MSFREGIPKSWVFVPLGELLLGIETGKSFKCEERPPTNDEIGVVKVSSVSWGEYQESESKTCTDAKRIDPSLFVRRGDFLFSRANTIELVGACVIAQQVTLRVMLSDKILRFRFARDEIKSWVLYLLRSDQGRSQIETLASGNQNSMRNIGQTRIGQILVPLPPAAEQTRIVAKLEELLSDLEAGVAELKAAQVKLARYRQSLLKAAVDGALTADWRARHTPAETGAQLLARILTERRARWEDKQRARFAAQGKTPSKNWQAKYPEPVVPDTTELPELPEGWVWASLDQCSLDETSITDGPFGSNLKSEHYQDSGPRVIRLQNIGDGTFVDARAHISNSHYQTLLKHAVDEGDVIVAMLGEVLPRACVVPAGVAPAIVKADCARVRLNSELLPPSLVVSQLNSTPVRDVVAKSVKGIGRPRINLGHVRSIPIALCGKAEQEQMDRLLNEAQERIDEQLTAIENGLKQSTAQRKNLLKAAFAGQLVPQDPADEPASVLLERIRAERDARGAVRQGRGGRRRRVAQGGA